MALLSLLDDPSPLVRKSIGVMMATSDDAPRALILGLLAEQNEISALLLARSPVLTDDDLVDAAAIGDAQAQSAIAGRMELSSAVCAALCEVGGEDALVVLAGNLTADIPGFSLERLLDRCGRNGALREALLARPDLPLALRQIIATQVADALSAFVSGCGWMAPERSQRVSRESGERVAISLAGHGAERELMALVAQLRLQGRLTASLILRSLLSAEPALAEAALADLSGMPLARASSLIHDRRGTGLRALYRKAGLPEGLFKAFAAAVSALHEVGFANTDMLRATISRRIVERVLIACESMQGAEASALMALLRRVDAEAARLEATEVAGSLADDAALAFLIETDPELLVELDVLDLRQAA